MNPVLLLLSVTTLLICWQVVLWIGWLRIRKQEKSFGPGSSPLEPVTLIVVARNEFAYLQGLLESVVSQKDVDFECILVLDRCTDHSLETAERFARHDTRIRYLIQEIPEYASSPKKSGLLKGINAARFENLVFTDADCILPPAFLAAYASAFAAGHQFVLGSGMYAIHPGFLNPWIQYETLQTAAQYHSLNGLGIPYMGVGRSIGYTRSAFHTAGGFGKGIEIRSGDDDLLVQRISAFHRPVSLTGPDACSQSVRVMSGIREYIHQKYRHISVSAHYMPLIKVLLAVFPASLLLFYTGLIWSIAGGWGNFGLLCLGAIWLVRWPFWILVAFRYHRPQVTTWFPLLDIVNVVYYLLMLPATWTKKTRWK